LGYSEDRGFCGGSRRWYPIDLSPALLGRRHTLDELGRDSPETRLERNGTYHEIRPSGIKCSDFSSTDGVDSACGPRENARYGSDPSSDYDSDYLYYNLDSRYTELRGESTGDGGRGVLNLTIIKSLEVPLPRLEEQKAISKVLLDFDAELQTLDRRLAKAKSVKQGMMQQLLRGHTRMPVLGGTYERRRTA
jgi:hypothetical protein